MREKHCSVVGCPEPSHAKGLCRRHYGRRWRDKPMEGRNEIRREALEIASERKQSILRELQSAQDIYDRCIGFQAHAKWGGKIRELKELLSRCV